ncbi:hypothetical protein E3N88_15553 [Mikania micrantha]|uniref:Zinc finger, CCHC-type n=1 Tax=Mikania micrantha TaxID=192012 RepID=A0A5N6NXZ8_9ASTR|nr:hypothetical protein E3N88_15553 [Mikania micrantha]
MLGPFLFAPDAITTIMSIVSANYAPTVGSRENGSVDKFPCITQVNTTTGDPEREISITAFNGKTIRQARDSVNHQESTACGDNPRYPRNNEERGANATGYANKGANGAGPSGSKDPPPQQVWGLMLYSAIWVNYVICQVTLDPKDDLISWWVDSGATSHVCKDSKWFIELKPVQEGSVLRMGNVSTEPIKGIGKVKLVFTSGKLLAMDNVLYVPGIRKNLISGIVLNSNGFKQVIESDKYVLSKHGTFVGFGYLSSGMFKLNIHVPFDSESVCMASLSSNKVDTISNLWHARLGHVNYARMQDMAKMSLIAGFDMRVNKCHTCKLTKITRKPFKDIKRDSRFTFSQPVSYIKPQHLTHRHKMVWQKERKNRTLKEMVNSMLSYSGLSEGFWGEAMLTACYLLNRIPNKKTKVTPYELWYKKVPNLHHVRVWGCRAVVRLTAPKMKTIGERGIYCIFIGYVEHSPMYRFYVIEPNEYVSIHSVIESRDADFGNEDRFSSVPRLKDIPQSLKGSRNVNSCSDISGNPIDITSTNTEPKKSTRFRKAKSFGSDFHLYLVEGTRNKVQYQYQYCYNIEEDPKTFSEAMNSRDTNFWKEAVQDEIDSIMHNKTWKLTDLPPGCKPLGSKWIFKKKMKVDGSIDKYKARLVIQGFRQKEGIDFFDTYAPVARISTIRLLLALAAIHNLIIHQMDVKNAFLNGELEEEIYMKQPEGFVMPGNEHKVYLTRLVKES